MNSLFQATPTMMLDRKNKKHLFTIMVVLIALSQFICASVSGPSEGFDPVPDWVHSAMNVAATIIGILVLIPKTRAFGALLSTIISTMSMSANYKFYGFTYFENLIPFNGFIFMVSLLTLIHYWPDLRHTFNANAS